MTGTGPSHFIVRLRGVVLQAASAVPRMTPGMGELLRELSEDFNLWLLCEQPEEELPPWWRPWAWRLFSRGLAGFSHPGDSAPICRRC